MKRIGGEERAVGVVSTRFRARWILVDIKELCQHGRFSL
jgi:hypothetical protein